MILAIKTDGPITEMWLLAPSQTPAEASLVWESGRELSDELLTQISRLLNEGNHSTFDLSGIVVYSGPGSFTSLRIGHTVANALADSLSIPVVGVRGDDWLTSGIKALIKAKSGKPALPFYGAEANITRPKA